ncbi:MAG: hypothetical protein KGJ90_00140 [Patescibacteria group bacterium]|nr:hypothetical protein [Patescibacteria group bacterium]
MTDLPAALALAQEALSRGRPSTFDIPNYNLWLSWAEAALPALARAVQEMAKWVNDLQSGMFINCVYCGHRYGPSDEVPASMADVLKAHVEQCPKHPMSALKAERDELAARLELARKAISQSDGSNDRTISFNGTAALEFIKNEERHRARQKGETG